MPRVVYKSNGGTVGDGWRQALVSNDGQDLAFMVDQKTGRTSEVELVDDTPPPAPQVGVVVQDLADLVATMPDAPHGTTFILSPGRYVFAYDPATGHDFLALSGHGMKVAVA